MTGPALQRHSRRVLAMVATGGCAGIVVADPTPTPGVMVEMATVLVYAGVGTVITRKRPENAIGWVFMLIAMLLALIGGAGTILDAALEGGPPASWWVVFNAWFYSWAWFPLLMLATTFTFLLYPSGIASSRWRWVLRFAVGVTISAIVLMSIYPTIDIGVPSEDANAWSIPNPLTPSWLAGTLTQSEAWVTTVGASALVICLLAGAWCVVLRTWRSTGIERLQMRLFAFVILLVPLHVLVGGLVSGWVDSVVGDLTFALIMLLIPVTCGVAILRYHLYEIDRIIGRTTAYAMVTAVLLAVYVVVVTSFTSLVPESGSTGQADSWVVAVATLAAAGLFRPVLRWARRLVDRRFNRDQFDAERAVDAFAVRLRDEIEDDDVRADLLTVLGSTVQPASAALWLKEPTP
jgi:hypothetical protein